MILEYRKNSTLFKRMQSQKIIHYSDYLFIFFRNLIQLCATSIKVLLCYSRQNCKIVQIFNKKLFENAYTQVFFKNIC